MSQNYAYSSKMADQAAGQPGTPWTDANATRVEEMTF
jgi:hypothetical protein